MPAYNSYYPATYNPYGAYPYQGQALQNNNAPLIPQPMIPTQMSGTSQNVMPASPSSILWVRNQNEAAMYPVAPNNAVALWDSSAPSIYLKQADASGKPTMKIFDLVERTETPSEGVSAQSDKLPTYATKDELGAVVGVVKGFDEVISGLKAEVETMKEDIYGLAGKKRPVRKGKDEKDDDEEDS